MGFTHLPRAARRLIEEEEEEEELTTTKHLLAESFDLAVRFKQINLAVLLCFVSF